MGDTSSASPATEPATQMTRSLLIRGLLAGLAAGLAAFVFARLIGEAALEGALEYEDLTAGHHGGNAPEIVGRSTQSGIGLATAYVLYGVAVGGILALVHASLLGRLGRLDSRGTAAVVASVGFVAAVLVPFLRYPPNPPASTLDSTVGARTTATIAFVLMSVALAVAATVLTRHLARRVGWWNATLAGAAVYIALAVTGGALLPGFAETPPDFPAAVLYDFRVASVGSQFVLWAVWAIAFAALVHRRDVSTSPVHRMDARS